MLKVKSINWPQSVVACMAKDDGLLSVSVTFTAGVSPGKLTLNCAVLSVFRPATVRLRFVALEGSFRIVAVCVRLPAKASPSPVRAIVSLMTLSSPVAPWHVMPVFIRRRSALIVALHLVRCALSKGVFRSVPLPCQVPLKSVSLVSAWARVETDAQAAEINIQRAGQLLTFMATNPAG